MPWKWFSNFNKICKDVFLQPQTLSTEIRPLFHIKISIQVHRNNKRNGFIFNLEFLLLPAGLSDPWQIFYAFSIFFEPLREIMIKIAEQREDWEGL